ncbi:MAG: ribonuclease P protein component [Prevotella sp.]|nr:ribonuclease P protein component [Prevotella sp.]
MAALGLFTLPKKERLCNRKEIDRLFDGANRSLSAYPLRVVYTLVPREHDGVVARMMVSVPKRCFKRAVKRNRVKRQVREAYRHVKADVSRLMETHPEETLLLAFVWLDSCLCDSATVSAKMTNLLERLCERL